MVAPMSWKDGEEPAVDVVAQQPYQRKENLSSSLWACILAVEELSQHVIIES